MEAYNILLDPLPDSFQGYLIRTDFRIGIQVSMCLQDEDMTEYERVAQALHLLFGNGAPPTETAVKGLDWFLNGWCKDDHEKKKEDPVTDFEKDAGRIYTAIKERYGIDLKICKMHWFEFMNLLSDVNSESAFARVAQIRGKKLEEIKNTKEQEEYKKLKKVYRLKEEYTETEQQEINNFVSSFFEEEPDI